MSDSDAKKPASGDRLVPTLLLGLALAGVTALAYWPALANGFVNWDDPLYITDNPDIRHLDAEFFRRIFTGPMALNYHPLTMISHAVDHALWGLNPRGHHLTSVLIHALNTVLLFMLLLRLFPPGPEPAWRSREVWAAGLTALLFGLHPIHVESVAWVSERKDVLYAAFYLLSLLAYVRYARRESRGAGAYTASLIFFLLSLLSKPMAVSLPLVLLVLDFFPLGRLAPDRVGGWAAGRRVFVEKIPYVGLALVFSLLTLAIQEQAKSDAPLLFRLALALFAWVFYLVKLVLPVDLAPFYPDTLVVRLIRSPGVLLGYLGLFAAITGVAFWTRRRWPGLLAAWGLYGAQLLPVLGIVQVGMQSAADRYTYLPSVPVFFLGSWLIGGLAVRQKSWRRPVLALAMAGILSLLFLATRSQIGIWKDTFTLWDHEIRLYPDQAAETYYNRGCGYIALHAEEEAVRDFNKAIELDPTHDMAYVNRGYVRVRQGRIAEALADFNRAIELEPTNKDAFFNRGTLFLNQGELWSALADYSRLIDLDPRHVRGLRNRGRVFSALGAYPEAVRDFQIAMEIDPDDANAHADLAAVYEKLGRAADAAAHFREAERLGWKRAGVKTP